MDSANMLEVILDTDTFKSYSGFGEISFPFYLNEGMTAMFLYVISSKDQVMDAPGVFILNGEECIFKSDKFQYFNQNQTLEIVRDFYEVAGTGEEILSYERSLEVFRDIFINFDKFSPYVFWEVSALPEDIQHAVLIYSQYLVSISDLIKLSGYYYYGPRFIEWCMDVCEYLLLTE
jgi:hypothetical protein